jgi:hypothetical protein
MRTVVLSAAVAVSLLFLGCDSDSDDGSSTVEPAASLAGVVNGETADMGDSSIQTWAELDEDGVVTSVGFTAGAAGLMALTEEAHIAANWPEEVKTQTFFNYLGMDFMHEGHGPEPYMHAHFDVHFYGEDQAETASIDCAAEPLPEGLEAGVPAEGNALVPDFYMIPSPALDPDGTCVPGMGVHALDVRSGELQMEEPSPFTATLILGYHAGALSFIEPMVTQAHFGAQADWSWEIPRPATLGRSVLWPGMLDFTYDSETETYDVVFSEFTEID